MGSDSSENKEEWQAGSKLPRFAGTQNLWLVDEQIELQAKLLNYFLGSNKSNINQDHTTGDEDRQARSKTGASHPDPSREESDSKS